jgi:hypothetical protein
MGAVLLGSADDREVCAKVADGLSAVDLCGRTTIAETMAIVQNARLMVCNDSMSLHMASAMKIPTVVIFCATSPAFGYGPWQNRAVVVRTEQSGMQTLPSPWLGAMPQRHRSLHARPQTRGGDRCGRKLIGKTGGRNSLPLLIPMPDAGAWRHSR